MSPTFQTGMYIFIGLAGAGLLGLVLVNPFHSILTKLLLILRHPPPRKPFPSELNFTTPNSRRKPSPLPTLSSPAEIVMSVVVPAYNEEARIKSMLKEAVMYLDKTYSGGEWEILIVDDGSADKTSEVALDWAAELQKTGAFDDGQLRVCRLEKNRGKGGAVSHVPSLPNYQFRECNMSVDSM
jgi:dolichyl-phosphate beta-glucosyltransferase